MTDLDKQDPKPEEINWKEIRSLLETAMPHAQPLILKWLDNAEKEQERKLEISAMHHNTAIWQLWLEIGFIVLTILFVGGIIWLFISNGQPDTAEKILFALLGFIGGRGFIKINTSN